MLALLPALAVLTCADAVPVFQDGARHGETCAATAGQTGLTLLDLSPDWSPAVLAPGPDGDAPAYRAVYLALAQGRFADAGTDGALAAVDRGLEVFGFMPTLALVAARLADDTRHACHAAIDDAPLAALTRDPREQRTADATAQVRAAVQLRASLEHDQAKRGLPDLDALAAVDTYHARRIERLRTAERYVSGVRTAQAHLACDGLLAAADVDGRLTW